MTELHALTSTHSTYSSKKTFVSEAEYWEKYYEHPEKNYEWHNGQLEEIGVSDYSTIETFFWFSGLLDHYLKVCTNGKKIGLEMGFYLNLPTGTSIRKPDMLAAA